MVTPHARRWPFAVVITAVLGFSSAAPAQPAAKPADKKVGGALVNKSLDAGTEHKIFAQLVEYLHRDTFPPGERPDTDVEPKGSGQIKLFVENRKKMIGYIRTRLRDMKASPELFELYDDYLAVLTEAEKYGDSLRKDEEEYAKGLARLRERYKIDVEIARLNGAARLVEKNAWVAAHSIGGWWGWGRGWYRRGLLAGAVLSAGNAIAADLRFHAAVLNLVNKYKDKAAEYDRTHLPVLKNQMRTEQDKFRIALEAKRPGMLRKGEAGIEKMAAGFGWRPFEVTLRPFDDADGKSAGGNPFGPLAKLNRIDEVTTTRQAEDCEAMADRLLELVAQIPPGSVKDSTQVYNRIRADVAFLAGMHANRAAEFQLGGDGFAAAVKSPVSAGKVGVKAFETYRQACVAMDVRPYPKAAELHQEALAWAYSGFLQKARNTVNQILPQDLGGMNDPKFFFDCARLQAIGGNDGIKMGMRYLSTAFLMGYTNAEKARVSPDLDILRKTNPDVFEKAVTLNKE